MFNVQNDIFKISIITTTAVIVIGFVLWKQTNKKRKALQIPVPTKWRKVGEVSKINMYPLKSGKYMSLEAAECTAVGLKSNETSDGYSLIDRSFVVYDEKTNQKVTIRDYPKLLFVEVKAVDKETVVFRSPGSPDLTLTIPTYGDKNFVKMWYQEKVFTVDCGQKASDWITHILTPKSDVCCRLGYYARNVLPARSIDYGWKKFAEVYTKMDDQYMGSYSDLASYMIMTQSSLDDLNSRLEKPVSQYNFRPNIMVSGTQPYEEDDWDWLKIGDHVIMRSFKLCTRCVTTTYDPEDGVKNPNQEPLVTLRKYRMVTNPDLKKLEGQAPVLGLYMGLHRTGMIKIGDLVFVNSV